MVSPFKTGNGIALNSAVYTPPPAEDTWFLDSSPTAEKSASAYLSYNVDFKKNPGCYWEVTAIGVGRVRLKTQATGTDRRYLDSSGAAPKSDSVYLTNQMGSAGSEWLPTLLPEYGTGYTFKSNTPSGTKRYLYAAPLAKKEESVILHEKETIETHVQTHWYIFLTHCTGESVQSYICAVYPSVPISSCEPNATYESLEYDRLHSIWKDTALGTNQTTPIANDCAVCLKAEVYKHSYDSDSPWQNYKGSLCGIMWGSIGEKMCALNFTIDPSQNVILFDSQNGEKIATDKFTPTFCMV